MSSTDMRKLLNLMESTISVMEDQGRCVAYMEQSNGSQCFYGPYDSAEEAMEDNDEYCGTISWFSLNRVERGWLDYEIKIDGEAEFDPDVNTDLWKHSCQALGINYYVIESNLFAKTDHGSTPDDVIEQIAKEAGISDLEELKSHRDVEEIRDLFWALTFKAMPNLANC